MERNLLFLSRHYPTMAQIELSRLLGYTGIKLERAIFPDTKAELKKMIDNLDADGNIVALAAPPWVHITFWQEGYSTIEFVTYGGDTRGDPEYYGLYLCKGLWLYQPDGKTINSQFIACQMSIDDQYTYATGKKGGRKF